MPVRNFTPFPILTTRRFTLRQPAFTDIDEIFKLRSDSSVNRFLQRPLAGSINEAGNFIRAINEKIAANESVYWVIADPINDKLIGTICLFHFAGNNNMAEIGYEVLPAFQRNGIMRESVPEVLDYAFDKLGLQAIEAYTHLNNIASTRLLNKFKFTAHSAADADFMLLRLTGDEWHKERLNK